MSEPFIRVIIQDRFHNIRFHCYYDNLNYAADLRLNFLDLSLSTSGRALFHKASKLNKNRANRPMPIDVASERYDD